MQPLTQKSAIACTLARNPASVSKFKQDTDIKKDHPSERDVLLTDLLPRLCGPVFENSSLLGHLRAGDGRQPRECPQCLGSSPQNPLKHVRTHSEQAISNRTKSFLPKDIHSSLQDWGTCCAYAVTIFHELWNSRCNLNAYCQENKLES